jgi:hypothetical protein
MVIFTALAAELEPSTAGGFTSAGCAVAGVQRNSTRFHRERLMTSVCKVSQRIEVPRLSDCPAPLRDVLIQEMVRGELNIKYRWEAQFARR